MSFEMPESTNETDVTSVAVEAFEDHATPESLFSPEVALDTIRHSSLDMTSVYLRGIGRALTSEDVGAGTYAELNGVILANVDGQILALPANDRNRGLIQASELVYQQGMVPHLNEADVWGTEEERSQNSIFKKWVELSNPLG